MSMSAINHLLASSLRGTNTSGSVITIPPYVTSWKDYVEWLIAKHSSSFLSSKSPLIAFVHFDRIVRPHGRLTPCPKERQVLIMGKVPQLAQGVKMGIQGNRNSFPGKYLTPILDGECIQDILPLESMKGEIKILEDVWNSQLKALRAIDRMCEMEADSMPILDAPLRFEGLVKGPNDLYPEERIEVIWEKFCTVDRRVTANVFEDRNLRNVKKGSYYTPNVLDYGSAPYCNMVNDVLIQHEMYDDHSHLIPPWEIMNEIRPGSILLIIGAIYERNVAAVSNGIRGYNRSYEIRGSWARVLKRGRGHPFAFPRVPMPLKLIDEEKNAKDAKRTLFDYPGFGVVKK